MSWSSTPNSTRYIPINSRNFEDFMAYAIVVYVITSSNYTYLSIYFYMCGFHCMENLFINTSRLNRTWFPPSYHCLFLSDNTHFFDYVHNEYSWYKQKWDSMIRVLILKICIEWYLLFDHLHAFVFVINDHNTYSLIMIIFYLKPYNCKDCKDCSLSL